MINSLPPEDFGAGIPAKLPGDGFVESEEAFEFALAEPPQEKSGDDIDMFDPANLRIDQSKLDLGISRPIVTTLAVRKPKKDEWFRVHPSNEFSIHMAFLEDGDNGEIYAITPNVHAQLEEHDYKTATLHLCCNRQGTHFLWPVKKSGVDGKPMRWFDSANDAKDLARKQWTRMVSKEDGYVMYTTSIEIPEPTWLAGTMGDMLKLAFRDRMIKDLEHPIILRLRGLA